MFHIDGGSWVRSPKAIALEAKSNAIGYAAIACSNSEQPMQSVRDCKIPGLRPARKGAAYHLNLYSSLPGIQPLNVDQCWHGSGSC